MEQSKKVFVNVNDDSFYLIIFFFHPGKATISNDGATILKLLDVVHPAAKTLVDIARSQDAEVIAVFSFVLTMTVAVRMTFLAIFNYSRFF